MGDLQIDRTIAGIWAYRSAGKVFGTAPDRIDAARDRPVASAWLTSS